MKIEQKHQHIILTNKIIFTIKTSFFNHDNYDTAQSIVATESFNNLETIGRELSTSFRMRTYSRAIKKSRTEQESRKKSSWRKIIRKRFLLCFVPLDRKVSSKRKENDKWDNGITLRDLSAICLYSDKTSMLLFVFYKERGELKTLFHGEV